jgi:hypothetical protein
MWEPRLPGGSYDFSGVESGGGTCARLKTPEFYLMETKSKEMSVPSNYLVLIVGMVSFRFDVAESIGLDLQVFKGPAVVRYMYVPCTSVAVWL